MASSGAIQVATAVVRSLTGGRWTWPPVRVTDRYPVVSGRVRLAGQPVIQVRTVKLVGIADADVPDWTVAPVGQVIFDDPTTSLMCRGNLVAEVDYDYGSEPSLSIQRAIEALADELDNSLECPDECRLPQRVTSVSRQGISWTMLDPMDFLDHGRTGLYEVDLLLSIGNRGKARARSRVFSTEYPPPDRRAITILTPS